MRFHLILLSFLHAFVFSPDAFSQGEACSSGQHIHKTQKDICKAECEIFYQENPEARPPNQIGVCETPTESLILGLTPGRRFNQAMACGSGVWQGVLTLPDQIRAYIHLAQKASTSIASAMSQRNQAVEECQNSLECKMHLVRDLTRFQNSSQSQVEIERFAQQTHAYRIMQELDNEFQIKQRRCLNRFHSLRESVIRDLQTKGSHFDNQAARLVYAQLALENSECPGILELQNPEQDESLPQIPPPGTSWLESIGIKLKCYNSEKLAELTCLEVTTFIVDPLNLAVGGGLYLKALRTAGVRASSSSRVSSEFPIRRKPEYFSNRNNLVQNYLRRDFTTEAQNRNWIEVARQTRPDGQHIFLDIENSKLKYLNETFKDKDFATALTNRHKEITLEHLDKLRMKHPQLEILEYSDFKSLRFAIKEPHPKGLTDDLSLMLQESNKQFHDEMIEKGILRVHDQSQTWFRGGLGETADQANLAARYSRGQNEVRLETYANPKLRAAVSEKLNSTEALRSTLSNQGFAKVLFEPVNEGMHLIPKREIFDLFRKVEAPNEIHRQLKVRFGQDLTPSQIQQMQDYVKLVDSFNPGIHIAKREVATVEGAQKGAVSMDFIGMGSYNLRETALALTRSNHIDDALENVRLAERRVTQMFERRMNDKVHIIDNYLGKKKNLQQLKITCSGDDCVAIFPDQISLKDQKELVHRLSKSDAPAGVRVSFISDKITSHEARNQMASNGESLEKLTRRELYGKLDEGVLNNLTLGVSMQGQNIGQGGVQLLLGNSRQALSPNQITEINLAFTRATQKLNQTLSQELRRDIRYQALPPP